MTAPRTITLELNEQDLALVTNALRAFLGDFSHDEPDVIEAIRSVQAKVSAASTMATAPGAEVTVSS